MREIPRVIPVDLNSEQQQTLTRILDGMTERQQALLFPLVRHFGQALRDFVTEELIALDRSDVLGWPDDIDHLVRLAITVLHRDAPVWPLSQLNEPWQWAEPAIRGEIARWANQPLIDWDNAELPARIAAAGFGGQPPTAEAV